MDQQTCQLFEKEFFLNYKIWMGIPEMQELWFSLLQKNKDGTASKEDTVLFKKWSQALKHLSIDPFYSGLRTHEVSALSKRYGMKVWQSYLENKKSGAMRMFWIYGPSQGDITIIGLEKHPEDKKSRGYDKVKLSKVE